MERIDIKMSGAVSDLVWLLDRGYPKKSALDLVGNRHSLDRDERLVLYRGVFDRTSAAGRSAKKCDPFSEPIDRLHIDGYNVLITIESYLAGKRVFRSLDGFVRDISGIYGGYVLGDLTRRSVGLLVEFVAMLPPAADKAQRPAVTIYLDEPVSRSGELASFIRESLRLGDIRGEVRVVKNPDEELKRESTASEREAVATSDTVVIDKVLRCVDIPSFLIGRLLGKTVADLSVPGRQTPGPKFFRR
jgi:hypothetical protein